MARQSSTISASGDHYARWHSPPWLPTLANWSIRGCPHALLDSQDGCRPKSRYRIGSFLQQIIAGSKKTVKLAAGRCIYVSVGRKVRAPQSWQGILTSCPFPKAPFFLHFFKAPVIPVPLNRRTPFCRRYQSVGPSIDAEDNVPAAQPG